MHDQLSFSSAFHDMPYFPNVIPVSEPGIRNLYRWKTTATCNANHATTASTHDSDKFFPSLVFTLDAKRHRHAAFTSLAHQSGWLGFQLLTVNTVPRIRYLLYVAINGDRNWADGLALETLFDFVSGTRAVQELHAECHKRMEFGFECHRQLSLAHWEQERQLLVAGLEKEISGRYLQRPERIEERLKDTRQKLFTENDTDTKLMLAEVRDRLRQALLDADAVEGEATRFLLNLKRELPTYELQPLFTMHWMVKPDPIKTKKPIKK